jgi:hypothetical protein
MSEIPIFRSEKIRALLERVLMLWTTTRILQNNGSNYNVLGKDNNYKQGMNELLAFIIIVLHRDIITKKNVGMESSQLNQLCCDEVIDLMYLEHDSFALLDVLMVYTISLFTEAAPTRTQLASAYVVISTKTTITPTSSEIDSTSSTTTSTTFSFTTTTTTTTSSNYQQQ